MDKDFKRKGIRGVPHVYNNHGRLGVRLTYRRKEYYLSTGLPHEERFMKAVEPILTMIERDIVMNCFDTTMERYKRETSIGAKLIVLPKAISVIELFDLYTTHQARFLEETTIEVKYGNVKSWLKRCDVREMSDASRLRDHLLAFSSTANAREILRCLGGACKWGMRQGHCASNPFTDLADEIRTRRSQSAKMIDPFSLAEMEAIIRGFNVHPTLGKYGAFVEFMFLTGARPSETIGLRWSDISEGCTSIKFRRAIVEVGTSGNKIEKGLKTQESRLFPCSDRLTKLLQRHIVYRVNRDSFVFPSDSGESMTLSTFTKEAWNQRNSTNGENTCVMSELIANGVVERYRSLYNTRHTFITHCLRHGVDVSTVASWAGNSPAVIYKHYCGVDRTAKAPSFDGN